MARMIITATEDANGNPNFGTAQDPNAAISALAASITAANAAVPSAAAFEAALATLVADGASPTQAHVTSVNNAYTTYKTAQTTYVADVAALSTTAAAAGVSADVTLLVNSGNVTKKNQLLIAVREMLNRLVNGTSAFV